MGAEAGGTASGGAAGFFLCKAHASKRGISAGTLLGYVSGRRAHISGVCVCMSGCGCGWVGVGGAVAVCCLPHLQVCFCLCAKLVCVCVCVCVGGGDKCEMDVHDLVHTVFWVRPLRRIRACQKRANY